MKAEIHRQPGQGWELKSATISRDRDGKYYASVLFEYETDVIAVSRKLGIFNMRVSATSDISKQTYYDYIAGLEKLMIIEDVEAWCPAIRSKTSIRASKKRNIVDPSIAAAALGVSPEYFSKDYKTLGFLFECLCIRDLKIYSSAYNGQMSYYHDRFGLEADGVLNLNDGRFALIEFKLGQSEVDDGASHLCEIERLIIESNQLNSQNPLRVPDLKIVVTGTQYGYRRDDGVFVIPIGCLRE